MSTGWSDLCDNYLELAKTRLYRASGAEREAAQWTLYHALLTILKLLAPYIPCITEEIYQGIFRERDGARSIHSATWPKEHPEWIDAEAEETGKTILELLRQVRRHKAEHGLSVGAELETLHISMQADQRPALEAALIDLKSATRAQNGIYHNTYMISFHFLLSFAYLVFYNNIRTNKDASQEDNHEPTELTCILKSCRTRAHHTSIGRDWP